MARTRTHINLYLDPPLKQELDAVSREAGMTTQATLRLAIRYLIDHPDRFFPVTHGERRNDAGTIAGRDAADLSRASL